MNYNFRILKNIKNLRIKGLLLFSFLLPSAAATPVFAEDGDQEIAQPLTYIADIVEINPDDQEGDILYMEDMGIKVLHYRDELALCYIPLEAYSSVKGKKGKVRHKIPKSPAIPAMNEARRWHDAHLMHSGTEWTLPYDASGIVVGFCDIGFDSNHVNFLSADGSTFRIKKVVQFKESSGEVIVYDNEEDIRNWKTDTYDDNHATHVAGIMAGAYPGVDCQGMAPGADIVATTSQLYDVGLLAGVEEIISYAKSVGKPAVINLSVGSYTGPHDGTSLFCRYLDKCGNDAIICIASGNEGRKDNTISMDFTEDWKTQPFQVLSNIGDGKQIVGYTDIWMDDSTPMSVSLTAYDANTDRIAATFASVDFEKTPFLRLSSNEDDEDYNEAFAQKFNGELMVEGELDPYNKRYHALIYYNMRCDITASPSVSWPRWALGGSVTSEAGSHASLYADGTRSSFGTISRGESPKPSSQYSISDLATGHNVISVGQFVNRDPVVRNDGSLWGADRVTGYVSGYSGYGTLVDGRVLPEVLAPGIPVVSSWSTPYLEAHPDYAAKMVHVSDGSFNFNDGQEDIVSQGLRVVAENETGNDDDSEQNSFDPTKYYWGVNGGTSMSCPYIAGTIACWLQANPTMTVSDVKGILAKTNNREGNAAYEVDPRNGGGWIRPYEGLVEAVGQVTSVSNAMGEAMFNVRIVNDRITVFIPDSTDTRYCIYDINGNAVRSATLNNGITDIDISQLTSGCYIVRITNGIISTSKKFFK